MSLSRDIETYEFEVQATEGIDSYYLADEVENKLLEWAERVEKLEEDRKLLNALRAEGVDNWEGWDYALDRLEDA